MHNRVILPLSSPRVGRFLRYGAAVPTSILLARHGQSEWNALGRWQGQADPPLSDLGRAQARSAAQRVGTVDVIVSSDLQRAVETAHLLAGALGLGPVLVDARLRERDAGEWSGLTKREIEEAWPDYLSDGRHPPSYESDESLSPRMHAALDEVARSYEGAEVLIVAHGGLVYLLEKQHGVAFERLPNLGAREVLHHGSDRLGEARLTLGNRVLLVDDELITTVPAQI